MIDEHQGESSSLLALCGKTSTAFYLIAILMGLSGLVLIVQRPTVSAADILAAHYSPDFARKLDRDAGDAMRRHLASRVEEMAWPFKDMAESYIKTGTDNDRVQSLYRFLNDRSADRERHIFIITELPEVNRYIKEYVEDELSRSETVTVPVLQSRIASGDFAFSATVLLIVLHLYAVAHRDYFRSVRRRAGGDEMYIAPSLLVASATDLASLQRVDRIAVRLFQFFFVMLAPVAMTAILSVHIWRTSADFSGQTRVWVSLILAASYSLIFWIWRWRVGEVKEVVTLWSDSEFHAASRPVVATDKSFTQSQQ